MLMALNGSDVADSKVKTCNICGNDSFMPAPNNRLSRRRLPPVCMKCRSMERHRVGRAIISEIRERERFAKYSLLQFNHEPVVAKGWFASVEISIHGKPNGIDLAKIDRPDGSYGFIVCSHIIAHVADHRRAIQELVRILSPEGLMFLSYPTPITRAETQDWGYPDAKQNGHYRLIGRDFEAEYARIVPGTHVAAVRGHDPVTGDEDLCYLVTKNFFWMRRAAAAKFDVRFLD